jgi:hypothetical protein
MFNQYCNNCLTKSHCLDRGECEHQKIKNLFDEYIEDYSDELADDLSDLNDSISELTE